MATVTVYFTRIVEIGVKVEVDDPTDHERAIEIAHDRIPELSAEASGWGRDWTRSENEVAEPESVHDDATGLFVWVDGGRWTRTAD